MTRRFKSVAALTLLGLLLTALAASPLVARDSSKGRWLKIRVYDSSSSTPNVLINLPMSLVSVFLRIAAKTEAHASIDLSGDSGEKARLHVKDLELEEVIRQLESMDPGQIIEVQEDDQRVSIWIE